MLTLALSKDPGEPFGWGICSSYLAKELSKKTDVNVLPRETEPGRLGGKILHAISDITFESVHKVLGDYNAGYCFFELDLLAAFMPNIMAYDHIFCGSSFNQKVLACHDNFHTSVLLQGVDHEIFDAKPPRKDDGKFYIFSGGKFEYRKGQDLVLAAFKDLMHRYKDIHLVTIWENMWPASVATMQHTTHIDFNVKGDTCKDWIESLCEANGIPPDRVTHYPLCNQEAVSKIMETTDLGIFPNRCEGGTNLMMMEYMAKQRPIIASYNTGHCDVLDRNGTNAIILHSQPVRQIKPFSNNALSAHWCEPDLHELIYNLEWAYLHRDDLKRLGRAAAETINDFTWEKAADDVLQQMSNPEIDKQDYLAQKYTFGNLLNRLNYTGEGVEIGVYAGTFSRFIYSRWKGKKLHLVDRWKEVPDYHDFLNQSQDIQDKLYAAVSDLFKDCQDVEIHRMESVEAAKKFKDGQLDWIYIDADHTAVKADLEAWFPKVRVGGLVAGHDYLDLESEATTFTVKTDVDEFIGQNGYKLKLSADVINPHRTWYFIKDR